MEIHNKVEFLLARRDHTKIEKICSTHRDRLHELLINAIVVDGKCFRDVRKAYFAQLLEMGYAR
jgi:hypothetical protein